VNATGPGGPAGGGPNPAGQLIRSSVPAGKATGKDDDDWQMEEFLLIWMKRRRRLDEDGDEDGDGDGHGKGNGNGEGNGGHKGPAATPFLVIPAAAGDSGARPIPVDAATSNMSIVAGIAQDSGTTWSQWQIQLSCTVTNRGAAVCAAGLAEFYIGPQFSVWNPGHELLTPAQVGANAQLVGRNSFRAPPGGTVTVVCPNLWQPGSPDAAQQGVLVQVYDALGDHLTTPYDAVSDRHVARFDAVMDPIIF
jgi:hypothetical protein